VKALGPAILAALALTMPAAGSPTSTPGVTATQILIGGTVPLSGQASAFGAVGPSATAYFRYVNAHGGVFGRKVKYDYQDDGYNPSNTATVTRKLVLQDSVFAMFGALGTPTHLAVISYLNTKKVPDLFIASGCNCWNNVSQYPYSFGWQTDYTIEGKILGQYINQNLAGKKVGYFYQNDEFGQDGVKGLDQKISSVVSRQTYVPTNTNVQSQVAALQASGAQVVAAYSIPAFTALALLNAAQLGYHPTWVVSNVGSDPPTLTGLLSTYSHGAAGGALLEGMVTASYLPLLGDSSNPWIVLFKRIHDQYVPNLPWDGHVLYGLAVAYSLVQELKAAGRNPTRAGIVKTIESKKLTDGPGLVPQGYSSSSHLGFLGVRVAIIGSGGTETAVGSNYVSTDTGPIKTYSGTPAPPPSNGIPND